MATEIKLPRLGQGMESGTIVRWLKAEGDAVKKREPLYELDTDKVTQEVGSTIAVIGNNGDDASPDSATSDGDAGPAPGDPDSAAEQTVAADPGGADTEPQAQPSSANGGAASSSALVPGSARLKASPLARRIARERGIDLAAVVGTGPDGRILAEDVDKAPAGGGPAAAALPISTEDVEVVTMTSIRKTIARRLTEAWTAPVFQLGVSIDMTEALHLREQLVERLAEGDVKPTVNDLLTRLVGVALVRHRAVNATFTGEEIHRHPGAHVGMAVAAPNGLVVPVIRDADRRSVQ
jgi:pyruvate dehydrogenase E2 component (dihydrolipoamide acetyltransferase)